jgi:nicotinate-nucleotide adenylyltransferase
MRIGLLGGTFDPIHIGHLVIADRAIETLKLDKLIISPAAHNPLKVHDDPPAPGLHRWLMASKAADGAPLIQVSDYEIVKGGLSYTYNMVEAIRKPDDDIYIIMGADAYNGLDRWYRSDDLAIIANFAVARRPGYTIAPHKYEWTPIDVPNFSISATEIRDRVKKGLSIKYVVPEAVEAHIVEHGLYR